MELSQATINKLSKLDHKFTYKGYAYFTDGNIAFRFPDTIEGIEPLQEDEKKGAIVSRCFDDNANEFNYMLCNVVPTKEDVRKDDKYSFGKDKHKVYTHDLRMILDIIKPSPKFYLSKNRILPIYVRTSSYPYKEAVLMPLRM